ncbi:65-kDa microtubule-associated protein 3 isoform X1 [Hevea brasiliensis]|uniref:65-kDa microtubule-associated protein 3 isoform X1 n=1 Tax=Hevea brasiliensis TaxID=3981 RepID=UPI0025F2B5C8|nr:65-kDa microtubule-associated protein 3 isoform X1 [Hevea brasiliensis]
MYNNQNDRIASVETTCGFLLVELQNMWDEVGENDVRRDKVLFEIEEECLEVYRRKVNEADKCRSELQREIAFVEAEIEGICSALSEQPVKYEQKASAKLKEKLHIIFPVLEELRKRKAQRKKQFLEVLDELKNISKEIFGSTTEDNLYEKVLDEDDLSLRRLKELQNHLRELQNEMSNRLKQVLCLLDTLSSLCGVLGVDFKHKIHEIHPTLDDSEGLKDMTNDTIERLTSAMRGFRDLKIQRMQRLQGLGTALLELWDLMDTPIEEQQMFQNVTSFIAASEPQATEPNMLSTDFINHVEDEVSRLKQLKSSKVKEIILKKRLELEELCRNAHMVTESLTAAEYSIEAVTSGVDPVHLLEEIEFEIVKVKEEAYRRKEILNKVEKWFAACEEECWLEEYNRDENRYNAGRGAHLTLKHAEKARTVVNKIPAMVEALTSKTKVWEKEQGIQFLYDGERLLSGLEQYSNLRKVKEQEKIRQRDQKRLQVQLMAEQEALLGAKSGPSKSGRKASRTSVGFASNRKLSLGGAMLQNTKAEKSSPHMHLNKKGRRNSEIGGHFVKKQSSAKACPNELRLIRKPLSPIPVTMSSQANIANFPADKAGLQDTFTKKPLGTPTKSISGGDEENGTPKTLPILVPTTPTTTSASMLMALTPTTPYVSSAAIIAKKVVKQNEYSFEELRAGFICPESQL